MIRKGDKKLISGWAFYDWAASVYNLVIATAVFPIFYNEVTITKENGIVVDDTVEFLGRSFVNTELYSYTISASLLLVVILIPMLSGIADYAGKKKRFMQIFCYIGATACASMAFFTVEHLEWSMLTIFFASVGFWTSFVFYNSFLPEIAAPEDQDRVSAKGFARGYIGSVLLLVINLVMIQVLNIPNAAQWSFVSVGLWWIGFAQITFRRLPDNPYDKTAKGSLIQKGFDELRDTYKKAFATVRLKRYLVSFFVFSMAVQTIMLMAQFFGMKEVYQEVLNEETGLLETVQGLETSQLIISILLVQIIAIPGAYLFSMSSKFIGNIRTLLIAIFGWIFICLFAYFVVDDPTTFYIIAGIIGLVMGGTQALARSTYSKFLPESTDHASFFSLYDVLEKIGIIVGTFAFGLIEGITGSMRESVLSLVAFFAVGFLLLLLVPKKEKEIEGQTFLT